jgi:hypothetical protein
MPGNNATTNSYLPYEVLIFVTGAVTLALEVLASRIMTPYFGVSLYIWAGILSITLIFLAFGYRLGAGFPRFWSGCRCSASSCRRR